MLRYSRQHSTLHFLISVYNFVIHAFYIQIDRKCHEKTRQEWKNRKVSSLYLASEKLMCYLKIVYLHGLITI
jgi:hypothetical protein